MLDIDCFDQGKLAQRMTYPVQIDRTQGLAWTAFGFGDGKSLKGCRAQLNFVVEKAGTTLMSVQNPVVIDPGPSNGTEIAVNPIGRDIRVSSKRANTKRR